jgi:nuclear protein localization protein 4 homolog
MDEDIPQELLDQIAAADAAASGSTGRGNIRICPHCTFENSHSGSDCEVCGLPLG